MFSVELFVSLVIWFAIVVRLFTSVLFFQLLVFLINTFCHHPLEMHEIEINSCLFLRLSVLGLNFVIVENFLIIQRVLSTCCLVKACSPP